MAGLRQASALLLGAAIIGFVSCIEHVKITEMEAQAYADYDAFRVFLMDQFKSIMSGGEVQGESKQEGSNLLGFSFKNCADPSKEQVVPSDVTLSPDPLKLPGTVTAAGSVVIKKNVTAPVQVALEVEKKFLGQWIKIPCVNNVGSCTYKDVCSMFKIKKCPAPLVKAGLGCKCPFPQGKFKFAKTNFYVNAKIPVSGGLRVKATATQGGQLITCAKVQVNIK